MAANGLELVPITSQKHDPAWKHCQMFKSGDKVQLKCLYCGKFFKGGGIHRIKEHLAGHKGNAATCLAVPADVRAMMQQSLDGLVVRRRKKQKIADEVARVTDNNNAAVTDLDPSSNQCDDINVSTGLQLIGVSDYNIEPNSSLLGNREGETDGACVERRKRGRPKMSTRMVSSSDANVVAVGTNGFSIKRADDQVHMAIGRFLYDIGAPLDAVNSAYFKPMVDAIASGGPGVVPPSYHDIRGWILKNSVQEVKNDVNKLMEGWGRAGCSILVDERKTEMGRVFLSFMVNCPEGTMFLKSIDATNAVDFADDLFELLKQVVEEVGVSHVLQVITNNEDNLFIDAGKRLMDTFPTLYWTSSCSHCIDLILEDIAKLEWIKAIIVEAKSITRFVYNHSAVLNIMKKYTFGNNIIDVGPTRNTTSFMTLKRIVDLQRGLQSMVTSQEWMDSPYSRRAEGEAILDIITEPSFWSSAGLIVRLTTPLLKFLRVVGGEKRPAMGFVYAGIYRVKETIKKELVNRGEYMVYWDIIDRRWKQQWHNPLHAAGFYLNPKFFHSIEGEMQSTIQSRIFDCIERLVPDTNVQDKITKELNCYKNSAGDFGRKMAVRARDNLLPAEWWSTYGGSCPNLARLAIRILSQTCSSTVSTRNWIPLERVHEMRNCLERQRLNDLVFVQYNLRLRQRGGEKKERDVLDPVSLHSINLADDWVSGKDEQYGNSHWMALDELSANALPLEPSNDEVEEFGAGFDDYEVFDSMKDGEGVKEGGNVGDGEEVREGGSIGDGEGVKEEGNVGSP